LVFGSVWITVIFLFIHRVLIYNFYPSPVTAGTPFSRAG
jgi:hypothetical protein